MQLQAFFGSFLTLAYLFLFPMSTYSLRVPKLSPSEKTLVDFLHTCHLISSLKNKQDAIESAAVLPAYKIYI